MQSSLYSVLRVLLTTALLIAGTSFTTASAQSDTITFGAPPWPGITVKSEVARQILLDLGYDAEVMNASTQAIMKGIAKKQIQVDMALWRPQHNELLDKAIDKGEAVALTSNLRDALYTMAVPEYVWDAGVHSFRDLDRYADKFDHKMYGLEAGMAGNEIMWKAIKSDTYSLSGWKVVPSSEPGMLAQVQHSMDKKEWIVFQGWQPHWMNVEFDMKYLEDPEGIWGGPSTIYTVTYPEFPDENPNVARFLRQMQVPKEVQSRWILEYSHNDRPADEVAREWIGDNRGLVAQWLDGVKAADLKRPAADVVAAAMAHSQ